MAYIYYGLYIGLGPLSRFIQFFTWNKRSHASAVRPPVDGVFENVIEAWRWGVTEQHWTLNHAPGTIIDVFRVPCTQRQADDFYMHMSSLKGKKYDFRGIFSFGLRMNIGRADKWFCSEAVAYAAQRAKITLLANVPAYKVFPGMLDMVPSAEFVQRLIVPKPPVSP